MNYHINFTVVQLRCTDGCRLAVVVSSQVVYSDDLVVTLLNCLSGNNLPFFCATSAVQLRAVFWRQNESVLFLREARKGWYKAVFVSAI